MWILQPESLFNLLFLLHLLSASSFLLTYLTGRGGGEGERGKMEIGLRDNENEATSLMRTGEELQFSSAPNQSQPLEEIIAIYWTGSMSD